MRQLTVCDCSACLVPEELKCMCEQQSGVVSAGCHLLPRPVHCTDLAAMLEVVWFDSRFESNNNP